MNSITGQIVFLYYEDLAAPRKFYGSVLGLDSYFEQDWVTLYRITQTAAIGIVKPGHAPAPAASGVMVSISSDVVDEWYSRLRENPSVKILKKIYDHPEVPIRAFLIEDPGGYSIEFFQWLK
jgi:predicted enzyme related to lactoylglutathione lyase